MKFQKTSFGIRSLETVREAEKASGKHLIMNSKDFKASDVCLKCKKKKCNGNCKNVKEAIKNEN